uniref:Transmembrane inner ear n=1 Tax=Iconisemion striatum TaxID=60296 RepID=A0A1A7WT38_9TELE
MSNFMKGLGGDGGIAKTIGTKAGEVVEETVNKVMGGKGGQNKEQQGGNKEQAAAGEGGNQAAGQGGSEGKGQGVDLNKIAGGFFK